MDNIKFRAWDEDGFMFVPAVLIFEGDDIKTVHKEQFGSHNSAIKLMQSTSLFDKNGIEIYEGDIIRDVEEETGEVWILHIIYADGAFRAIDYDTWAEWIEENCADPAEVIYDGCEVEVIGNVYENHELVEEIKAKARKDYHEN